MVVTLGILLLTGLAMDGDTMLITNGALMRIIRLFPKVHADHHGLTYAADGTLIIANDGGVYTSTNGSTFENKSEGLFIGQIYRLNVAQDQDDLVVSGLQDCGTQKMDGSFHQSIMGGDGMDNFIVGQSSFPQADNGWLGIYRGSVWGICT